MRAGLVGWETHYLRPIIPYYQTLGVALVITPRQISRPPDAFIRRLRVTVMSDIIKVSPGTHRNKLVVLSSPALLYIRVRQHQQAAPAGVQGAGPANTGNSI